MGTDQLGAMKRIGLLTVICSDDEYAMQYGIRLPVLRHVVLVPAEPSVTCAVCAHDKTSVGWAEPVDTSPFVPDVVVTYAVAEPFVPQAESVTAALPARFKGLSHDEMLVFQLIQQSGNLGAASPAAQ
jgi:hypothetical protein